MTNDKKKYAVNEADRAYVIQQKFGSGTAPLILGALQRVIVPTDQILGAIVFLAREHRPRTLRTWLIWRTAIRPRCSMPPQ